MIPVRPRCPEDFRLLKIFGFGKLMKQVRKNNS
jgi:hypothetical protein